MDFGNHVKEKQTELMLLGRKLTPPVQYGEIS